MSIVDADLLNIKIISLIVLRKVSKDLEYKAFIREFRKEYEKELEKWKIDSERRSMLKLECTELFLSNLYKNYV